MLISAQYNADGIGYTVTVVDDAGAVVDKVGVAHVDARHKYSDAMVSGGVQVSPYIPPQPSPELLLSAVDLHLNAGAQLRQYDDIKSAVTYVGDPDPQFDAEGVAYRDWRSAVYRYCHTEFAKVQAGTRTMPTEAELITELEVNAPLNLPPAA